MKSEDYDDLCNKYFAIFSIDPRLVRAYSLPTIEDLKNSISSNVEYDFYTNMPEDIVI
jgi:hypothetical protein